ncbi:CopL family metal-binding regulatory protein [Novilysobacter antarcticus]|uniref:CopL family metal-binding regulatory protein n=1 Tax=Novilysobacter antarcticus TaxID=2862543 RepID=UPI001C99BE16|nr:CopL family metal-binding regulatory protein [Lysobacter antarcticus]
MPIPHLLLRVLLCLALVLNGSGLAVATTQMHGQHAGMEVPVSTPDDHMGCLEHARTTTPDPASAPCNTHSAAAECCEGSSCDPACPAGMLWAVTVPSQGWSITPQVLTPHQTFSDHPAPLLQSRYRPPIG